MKINAGSQLGVTLKRVFIRFYIAPFYLLVIFPYIVLASVFGEPGEQFLQQIVNSLNGHFGSNTLINENDIIRATATLFIIGNVLAEIFLRLTSRWKTGISYRTDILIRAGLSLGGWMLAAMASLVVGEGFAAALLLVAAGAVSGLLFAVEWLVRKVLRVVYSSVVRSIPIVGTPQKM